MANSSLPNKGQLSFGRSEDIGGVYTVNDRVDDAAGPGDAALPAVAADPLSSGASGMCMKCEIEGVLGETDSDRSRASYEFGGKGYPYAPTGMDEIWLTVKVLKAYPSLGWLLSWFSLHEVGTPDTMIALFADTASGSRIRSWPGGDLDFVNEGGIDVPATNAQWTTLKVHYKKASTGVADGILAVWVNGTATINETTHENEEACGVTFLAQQTSTIRGITQDNSVYFKEFAWGPDEGDEVWEDTSLSFGAAHSGSDASNIDVRLLLDIDPVHFTAAELNATLDTTAGAWIKWEYKKDGGAWTTFATDTEQAAHATGDYSIAKTITGLDENSGYSFRAVVDKNNGSTHSATANVFTTGTITLTTPSADTGTPTTLKYIVASCNNGGSAGGGTPVGYFFPYEGWDVARTYTPHGLIFTGDFVYMDGDHTPDLQEPSTQAGMLQHMRAHTRNSEIGNVHRSMSTHIQPDDHDMDISDSRKDPAVDTDPPLPIPQADWAEAWDSLLSTRRINKFGSGRFEVEGLGTYWTTAKTLFLCLESRSTTSLIGGEAGAQDITNAVWAAGVATVTSAGHGLILGSVVDINGVTTNTNYEGHHRVTSVSGTDYTFDLTSDPGATAGTDGTGIENIQRWGSDGFTDGTGGAQLALAQAVITANPKPIIVVSDSFPVGVMASSISESVEAQTEWIAERYQLINHLRTVNAGSLILFASAERHQAASWSWVEPTGGERFTEYSASPISGKGVGLNALNIDTASNIVTHQSHPIGATAQVSNEVALTSISQASNAAVVSAAVHGLSTGDTVVFGDATGMTEINGLSSIVTVSSTTEYTCDDIDSTAFTAHTSSSGWAVDVTLAEMSGFAVWTIDESALTVQVDMVNGLTGAVMYTATHLAGSSSPLTGVVPIVFKKRRR